jgi:predicted RNase H-like nuclease (RuvC/YqgF family)
MKIKDIALSSLTIAMLAIGGTSYAADSGQVIATQAKANKNAQTSQAKIDKYAENTDSMLAEYKGLLRQIDSMKAYNQQIEKMVNSQQVEIDSLNSQISQIDQTAMEVVPLTLNMVQALEDFIELDLPFQIEERGKRVAELKRLMDRADVTTSEKYRKVMEAYQIEEGFSRSIESYKASLERDGEVVTYDFLRIGRTALLYQSPDGLETGMWNQQTREWEALPEHYRGAVQQGLRVAKKQAPPALIKLPIYTGENQ